VDQGIVGVGGVPFIATLDELRAIDCGAPLDLETLQVKAKIKKWDGDEGWVLTGTDYSTYMWEINKRSATLMLVLSDGTYKKYKVVAGSSGDYNPGVTLGDAINWTIGRDASVPTQEENQMWYFGFSADAFNDAKEWIDANNNIQDLTLEPNWEIVVRAQSTEPEPQIEWAFYRADMKGVCALVTDDMGIESVIAHVKISDGYTDLTMTDDNGDAIYVVTTTDEMVVDEDAYVIATDIEENSTQSEIEKPPTPVKPPLASGDYVITAKHSGKSLTVEGGSLANMANVIQYRYWGDEHQKWHLKHVGDGNYEITAMHSGKCLEVADSLESNGVNVRQNECNDAVNQKWQLADAGDGYYKIVNKNSDKCLDVSGTPEMDIATCGQLSDYNSKLLCDYC
jgi:hypothetical protein